MPQDNGAPGLGAGWIIPRWLSWALVGVPVGGAALVFFAIAVMGVPRLYHSVTPNDQGVLPAVTTELSAALREHQAIVRVVGMCAATPNPQHVRDLTTTFVTIMAASMNPASTATDGPNPANERDDNDSDS